MRPRPIGSRPVLLALTGAILASGGAAAIWGTWPKRAGRAEPQHSAVHAAPPATDASIERFCSQHHALPPPEIFERRVWVKEIDRMYPLAGYPPEGGPGVPPRDAVLAWYQARAKETLEPPFGQGALGPGPLRVRKKCFNPRGSPPTPAVANVQLARLSDPRRLDLIFCDMR